ncbi:MAG: hypothetical protein HC848_06245 [Limnobacter sp.]|nr:hypothetical protein [Limnobacter sp.]
MLLDKTGTLNPFPECILLRTHKPWFCVDQLENWLTGQNYLSLQRLYLKLPNPMRFTLFFGLKLARRLQKKKHFKRFCKTRRATHNVWVTAPVSGC